MLKGNAVVGQSGGPTAAINATLAGVIRGAKIAKNEGRIDTLYGMRNGIEGFLREDFINLTERFENDADVVTLSHTPAAALGSCRKKMKNVSENQEEYAKIIEILRKHNIRYFFYIGGNDSMDTVLKLDGYAKSVGYEMCVVGIPKTVDNDLAATDHTPGFGSAAKFVATVFKELVRDVSVYTLKAVTIVEVMGRDAGWLTASSALAKLSGGQGPDLVYLPECAFDSEKFVADCRALLEKKNAVLVAVSEGIKFSNGKYVSEGTSDTVDAFGHKQLSGTAKTLELLIKERLSCKVRSIELNLPQRCAGHILSATDINESLEIGKSAVSFATNGVSGAMITVIRSENAPYSVTVSYADISKIANAVRSVPREYINNEGNGVNELCLDYLYPLIQGEVALEYENGLPKHIVL